jgi:hypothetical protein
VKLDGSSIRAPKRQHRRFVTAAVGVAVAAGFGLASAPLAEAAGGHNLVLTKVPSVGVFRDPSTLEPTKRLTVRAANVLASDGHSGCFTVTAGQDRSTGWQVEAGVKVQAYLHAAADCSDGASTDSPVTTVVPSNVTTADFWFSLS